MAMTYGTGRLKLDTRIANLVIFSMSLGETCAHLASLLHAHVSNVTSIVHCKSISSRVPQAILIIRAFSVHIYV